MILKIVFTIFNITHDNVLRNGEILTSYDTDTQSETNPKDIISYFTKKSLVQFLQRLGTKMLSLFIIVLSKCSLNLREG